MASKLSWKALIVSQYDICRIQLETYHHHKQHSCGKQCTQHSTGYHLTQISVTLVCFVCTYTQTHTLYIPEPFLVPLLDAYSVQELCERKMYWHYTIVIKRCPLFCQAKHFIITHGTDCLELNTLNITQPVFS